jgi:hypothetical protein
MVFPLWHIALTGLVAAVAGFAWLRFRESGIPVRDAALGVVVSVAITGWRAAGNVGPLNDDPVPPFSPNDLLAPIATYVLLGMYLAWRGVGDASWQRARAALVLIAFVVNLVLI